MSQIFTLPIASSRPSAERPGFWARISAFVGRVGVELRIRHDLRAVGELDDRSLRDIGLAPGGLEAAVRTGRPPPRRDPFAGNWHPQERHGLYGGPVASGNWTEWR